MLCSQWLLSMDGPLRLIWIAAHCQKRLKKLEVKKADISASVDKILLDEVPSVTYRILGYLLLGVVRIYSKKVEYLYDDCCSVLTMISYFAHAERAVPLLKTMCSPLISITLPERFELDTFDLGIMEDDVSRSGDVRPREVIMLEDARGLEGAGLNSLIQYQSEEDTTNLQAASTSYTPVKDVISPHFKDANMMTSHSDDYSNLDVNMEKFHGSGLSLEEWLNPLTFELLTENEPISVEPYSEHQSAEGHPCIPVGVQEDQNPDRLPNGMFQIDEELQRLPSEAEEGSGLVSQSIEHRPDEEEHSQNVTVHFEKEVDINGPLDGKRDLNGEQIELLDLALPEAARSQMTESCVASTTVDITAKAKVPDGPGSATPELLAVCTPAAKEPCRILKKRKCLFDEATVIPSKKLKQCINDASDLTCKRKKAPYSPLLVWKAKKFSHLPETFSEPLVPCTALDHRSVVCEKTTNPGNVIASEAPMPEDTPASESLGDIENTGNSGSINALGSPTDLSAKEIPDAPATPTLGDTLGCKIMDNAEHTPIAPATPVARSSLPRLNEDRGLDEPASGPRKQPSSSDQELLACLMDEEINSCEVDMQQEFNWSSRSRTVAKHLHRKLMNQKGEGEEALKLSELLKGNFKKESARLFYEILVLKSGDYVDVRQENAYDDILVMETPKLCWALKVQDSKSALQDSKAAL